MSLDNLARLNRLHAHQTSAAEISRLLAAAERNLRDADVAGLSDETRFDASYKALMQCALVGLLANGYRPSTTTPGHHQTMIQSLGHSLGVATEVWVVLDALRKKRNANDYLGDPVEPAAVRECRVQAQALLAHTRQWLRSRRPDLLAQSP